VLAHGLVVGLWVVALALTVWILGPVVGFLLGRRRLEVDVHPESLIARPYPEDVDGQRRYEQFLALGFHPVGWTSQHARFLTPLHWRWRSVEGARWLASPDKRTFACIYRVVASEPARFGAVTLLDGEGSWETYYPGAGLASETFGNRGRAEVRGVEPAELLAKHAEHVETFRRERGLAVRPATLAEVADATLTYSRDYLTKKQGAAGFLVLPLSIFALPASFSFALLARGTERAYLTGAIAVILTALFYGFFRYGVLALTQSYSARRTHTREFDLEQSAVAPDGTIVPGAYERWVRVVAALGAADMIARLALIAVKGSVILSHGPDVIFGSAMLALLCALNLWMLAWRASGRAVGKAARARRATGPWFSWGLLAWLFSSLSKNGHTPSRLAWLGGVAGLALTGWWLEKRGRR
jgi:hypothetical protein